MRTHICSAQNGSVLVTAILTLTILSMICAVSLYVTSQNTNSTSQTASWQAALSGAESGVEQAYYALNKSQWTGWKTVSGSLPTGQPTGGTTTTAKPVTGSYTYFTRTMQISGEGGGTVKFWVTIDTAGLGLDHNGNQWYRIRASGVAAAPGPARVSNEKRDNDLRKISLRTDRISGLSLSSPQAARTIEVIAKPEPVSTWNRAITLSKSISMNGNTFIDSFDSTSSFYSTNHLYDPARRLTHGDLGTVDSEGSDLQNSDVWGSVTYSGPAIKRTNNVHGAISTPFQTAIQTTSDPIWVSGTYTSLSGGSPPSSVTAGTTSNPALVKISGDFKLTGNSTFTINPANNNATDNAIIIWVTGDFKAAGTTQSVIQDPNVKVTWIVDGDITVAGTAYSNASGYASMVNFIGVGNHQVWVTGTGDFIGTVNAPGYDAKIDGTGSYVGALIATTLDMKGGGGFHYDEALGSGFGATIANYSYASWFEDIADVPRGSTY